MGGERGEEPACDARARQSDAACNGGKLPTAGDSATTREQMGRIRGEYHPSDKVTGAHSENSTRNGP